MRIAVFPGSFDPITMGHYDIVTRALPLFDKIIVALGVNSEKKYLFPLETRKAQLEQTFAGLDKVEVQTYQKLTAHYCRDVGADFILRGIRNSTDFNYENSIAHLNSAIGKGIETVFLISSPQYSHISSTIVREIIRGGEDASALLPPKLSL